MKTGPLALLLSGVVVAMFGFGYALVPLYDLFCEITGIGGRTGVTTEAQAGDVVDDRWVTVEFTGNVANGLAWEFRPLVQKVKVHPGAVNEVAYFARNLRDDTIVGQAIPSVTPSVAARYFNKTECFCFSKQTLAGGESKQMALRFVVDPKLPPQVNTITLSYAFFDAGQYANRSSATTGPVQRM
jgi:cytochrome c oxidase assembly protein subunit 11